MSPRPDGASTASGSSTDTNASWDTTLSEAIASTGIDPTATFEDGDSSGSTAPQGTDSQSSDGASNGRPSAPAPVQPGDDGASTDPASEPSAPVASTPEPVPDAQPFTYTVDGQARTIEGAMVLPGDGLYVPEAQIPHFQQLASTAVTLERQNRELYDKTQQWERLTTWEQTGADGTPQTLTGPAAVEAMRVNSLQGARALQTIVDALNDPERFNQLVQLEQTPDGQIVVRQNEQMFNLLRREAMLASNEAAMQARTHMATLSKAPPPPEPSLDDLALPTVKAHVQAFKITGLTAEDEQYLAKHLPRFVRNATPQERQQHGHPKIVDETFREFVQDRAAIRAAAVKAAQTSTKTDTFNAGMNGGRKTPPKPAGRSNPTPTPKPAQTGKAAQWDKVFQDAMDGIVV